jgi:hypothetical protein
LDKLCDKINVSKISARGSRMSKWFPVLLIVLTLVLTPVSSRAQDSPSFSSLRVSLWPEFDHPDLLVIYRFSLSNTTSLPATLTFRIPTTSGEPHAVAVGAREDMVGDVPYNRVVRGEWAEITFIATMPSVQFEYYEAGLQKDGSQRFVTYQWLGEYAVESMIIEVQQPVQSTNMRISPSLGPGQTGRDGLIYYIADWGALRVGETFNISLEYQKENDLLSAEQLVVQPSQPLVQNAPGGFLSMDVLPIAILGFLGFALMIGGGVWYWQSSSREFSTQKPRKRGSRSLKHHPQKMDNGVGVYCHQCGKRAAAGDRFCRSCGIRLRLE